MKYYIFRVKDNLDQEYYVLNNQYIGYLGCDHKSVRSIIEWGAGENTKEKKLIQQYQLYAESGCIADGSEHDAALHKLNCDSTRFTKREAQNLIHHYPEFIKSKDKAWYKIYYPNKNSTVCHLREMGGIKTIK